MPQIGRFPEHMRVGQLFELMHEIRRDTHSRTDEDLMHAFQIDRIAHQTTRTLSGGTRQKISACLAFLFDPEVLVLDEPTAGLDPVAVEALKEKVCAERARGKLILLTSHILSDLDEIATDVLYLIDGRMQFYRPIEALKAESGEIRLSRVVAQIMRAASGDGPRPGASAP
jgi:Cu-processing system ATP-binding protein